VIDNLDATVGEPLRNKPISELTDAEARSLFEVRYWGQFNAVRAGYPHVSRSGSITLVSGLAGHRASPGRGVYAGVLGGTGGMVKSFAAELRSVRVNGVCAGAVDTELWHRVPEAERLAMFEPIGARLPVGSANPRTTGFSTGETIVVDGGAPRAPP
jgi:NAD(P)-dependent dehydrogenase (short-subunit alcohol dehydrogenase family)